VLRVRRSRLNKLRGKVASRRTGGSVRAQTSVMMPKTRIEPGSINSSIATRLKEVAQILEEQRANIFRVGAYRQAAAIMAERLHDELGIETLEELEIAAHDGRLARVSGFGPKRIAGIRDSLATRLGRVRGGGFAQARSQPPVSEILNVDREYRRKSSQGLLPTIAPRRFNPRHEKWLPILHTSRGERHYTALFSNTPRAHQLNKTADWVVIYYDGRGGERQCTVIKSGYAPLAGKRIIRGREPECLEYYLHPIPASVRPGEIQNGFSL